MSAHSIVPTPRAEFIRDVLEGLGNSGEKWLPSSYLYDEIGAALFETITLLPEYGLTRADARLLELHSSQIADSLPSPLIVAELGSGSGQKTRWLLEALTERGPLDYYPIDISRAALVKCRGELGRIGGVRMQEVESSYLPGLSKVLSRRRRGEAVLVLFLGSTIGNFDRAAGQAFLTELRSQLAPGDALLLGTDLVKPVDQLLAAYDDSIGVTAAFNLNMLARLNRELGADFALRNFTHAAIWNGEHRRIEMHLRSVRKQQATIRDADLTVTLDAGETIWTESSYKYETNEVRQMARRAGFECHAQWTDEAWPFTESLLIAQ
jgi:L-histidine N-alpha-methyltransferase